MGRKFVDVSSVPLKQFTTEKSRILLIEKFFFWYDSLMTQREEGAPMGRGESALPYVNKFKGVAALNRV